MFNQYLYNSTSINQYLTDTEFDKVLVKLVKYQLSIGLDWLYKLNIALLRFLPWWFFNI